MKVRCFMFCFWCAHGLRLVAVNIIVVIARRICRCYRGSWYARHRSDSSPPSETVNVLLYDRWTTWHCVRFECNVSSGHHRPCCCQRRRDELFIGGCKCSTVLVESCCRSILHSIRCCRCLLVNMSREDALWCKYASKWMYSSERLCSNWWLWPCRPTFPIE